MMNNYYIYLYIIIFIISDVDGFATPCTQYNDRKTKGDNTCMECTMMRFSRKYVKQIPQYINVIGRDGESYPVKRFLPIDDDKPRAIPGYESSFDPNDQTRCMWCPYTQQCGHPLDFRVRCARPGDPASSQKGFISRHDCHETWEVRRSRLDKEFEREGEELETLNYPDMSEYLRDNSKIAQRPVETFVRETQSLSWADTYYECFGRCVYPGDTTFCSPGITKGITSAVSKHAKFSVPGVDLGYSILPASKTPKPCSMTVPDRDLKAARVHGIYSHTKNEWIACDLISCEKLLALKEDNQHRLSPKGKAKLIKRDLNKFAPKVKPSAAKPNSGRYWF